MMGGYNNINIHFFTAARDWKFSIFYICIVLAQGCRKGDQLTQSVVGKIAGKLRAKGAIILNMSPCTSNQFRKLKILISSWTNMWREF